MEFGRVRRALVWTGAAALVAGTTGVLGATGAGATATASKPAVAEAAAKDVTATTAKLTAKVNPNGAKTSISVACTGGSYAWSANGLAAGGTPSTVTASLTSLTPETGYSCTLTATNSAGSTESSAIGFTTPESSEPGPEVTAPTVGDTTATDVTDTTATLSAPVNPGGGATTLGVTCTGGTYKWTATGPASGDTPALASADLTELEPGTEYTCSLKATNSAGTTQSSAPAVFTTTGAGEPTPTPTVTPTPTPDPTPAPDAGAPTVGPTAAAGVTSDSATLTGSVTPNGIATAATATCTGGAWTAGGAFAGSGTAPVTVSVPLTGLSAGTKYVCAIQATNTAGTTTSAGPVSFVTNGAPKPPTTSTAISIKAKTFNAKKGKSKTYAVATFTDKADLPASSYKVTINWGDGTSSTGKVVRTGKGTYKVTGKHKYTKAGKKTTKVTVSKSGSAKVTSKGRANTA
ncbi:fibronectin type III domain-containing protein [Sporichthya brevicatena]